MRSQTAVCVSWDFDVTNATSPLSVMGPSAPTFGALPHCMLLRYNDTQGSAGKNTGALRSSWDDKQPFVFLWISLSVMQVAPKREGALCSHVFYVSKFHDAPILMNSVVVGHAWCDCWDMCVTYSRHCVFLRFGMSLFQ